MSIPIVTAEYCEGAASRTVRNLSASPGAISRIDLRNSVLAVIDQTLVSGANFATAVLIGRFCGMTEYGTYALAYTVLILITTMHESLVLAPYTVYFSRISGRRRAQYAGSVLTQYAVIVLMVTVGLLITGLCLGYFASPTLRTITFVIATVAPFTLLRDFGRRLAFAHLNVVEAMLIDFVVACLQLGGLILLAKTGTLAAIPALVVIGAACAIAGGGWLAFRRKRFLIRRSRLLADARKNIRYGKWSLASRITSVLQGHSVPWLLALLHGVATTGGFVACSTLIAAFNPFLMGIGSVLAPRTALAFSRGGIAELRQVVWQATLLVTAVTAVFSAILAAVGNTLLVVIFDAEYAPFGSVITVLAIALLINIIGMAADNGLRAVERPNVNFAASLAGLVVTGFTAIVLIHAWGALGGAVGLLFGSLTTSGIRCILFSLFARNLR